MKSLDFARDALGSFAAAAMLAGCGGLNSPQVLSSGRQGADTLPLRTKGSALLYTARNGGDVSIFTLGGKNVGEINDINAGGLCSDSRGDVFVVNNQAQTVVEYAHGSTSPIVTLSVSGYTLSSCAVDAKTGNLAVVGADPSEAIVAVFANARRSPTVYATSSFREFGWCTYDASGNLFANGSGLGELASGSSVITQLTPSESLNPDGSIQWDGTYVVVANPKGGGHPHSGPNTLYQLSIKGSDATVVHAIELSGGKGAKRDTNDAYSQFWIRGNKIAAARNTNGPIALWRYPAGGTPLSNIKAGGGPRLGLTISLGS